LKIYVVGVDPDVGSSLLLMNGIGELRNIGQKKLGVVWGLWGWKLEHRPARE